MTREELLKQIDAIQNTDIVDNIKHPTAKHFRRIKFLDLINRHVAQQKQELLAEVRGIIGEDEIQPTGRDGWSYMCNERPRNKLRSELRTKLDELQERV